MGCPSEGGVICARPVVGLVEVALDSWVAKGDKPTAFLCLLGRGSEETEPGRRVVPRVSLLRTVKSPLWPV